jgi:hypothetical protein
MAQKVLLESVKQMQKIERTVTFTFPSNKAKGLTNRTKPTARKKRGKLTIILLAPIIAVVFIASWGISWIGQPSKATAKTNHQPRQSQYQ